MKISTLRSLFNTYLLPGFIFQSVVVAGAYATGREIVEFYSSLGPLSGILAILFTMLIWSLVSSRTFHIAYSRQAFHYKSFIDGLLGRYAFLFEITFMLYTLIILAIITTAAGNVLYSAFNLPMSVGIIGMTLYVSFTVMHGKALLEKLMSIWSLVLYTIYVLFLVYATHYGLSHGLYAKLADYENSSLISVTVNAIQYSGYNLGLIPVILFCLRHQQSAATSKTAGIICGVIATIPAILIFTAFLPFYPEIMEQPFPTTYVLQTMNMKWFEMIFAIMLYGTLMETAAGLLLSLLERANQKKHEKTQNHFTPKERFCFCILLITSMILLSQFGIVDLIAKGYATIAWLMIAFFILPLFLKKF